MTGRNIGIPGLLALVFFGAFPGTPALTMAEAAVSRTCSYEVAIWNVPARKVIGPQSKSSIQRPY